MLGALISRMEQTELMDSELRQMGQRHADYGVLPSHYETVGTALLAMLEETLRADFTKPVREAWTTFYRALAEAMQAGAAAVRAE